MPHDSYSQYTGRTEPQATSPIGIDLERVRFGASLPLSRAGLPGDPARLELSQYYDQITEQLTVRMIKEILGHTRPPSVMHHTVSDTHTFTVRGTVTVSRPATWLDLFKAEYRARWWARIIGSGHWRVREVDVPVGYEAAHTMPWSRCITVTIIPTDLFPALPMPPGDNITVRHYSVESRSDSVLPPDYR